LTGEKIIFEWMGYGDRGKGGFLQAIEREADGMPIVIPDGPTSVFITFFDEELIKLVPPQFYYAKMPFPVGPKRTFYAWAGKLVAT
jgi:hypothetical protein